MNIIALAAGLLCFFGGLAAAASTTNSESDQHFGLLLVAISVPLLGYGLGLVEVDWVRDLLPSTKGDETS